MLNMQSQLYETSATFLLGIFLSEITMIMGKNKDNCIPFILLPVDMNCENA